MEEQLVAQASHEKKVLCMIGECASMYVSAVTKLNLKGERMEGKTRTFLHTNSFVQLHGSGCPALASTITGISEAHQKLLDVILSFLVLVLSSYCFIISQLMPTYTSP